MIYVGCSAESDATQLLTMTSWLSSHGVIGDFSKRGFQPGCSAPVSDYLDQMIN